MVRPPRGQVHLLVPFLAEVTVRAGSWEGGSSGSPVPTPGAAEGETEAQK